jgi:hypothetical protein
MPNKSQLVGAAVVPVQRSRRRKYKGILYFDINVG